MSAVYGVVCSRTLIQVKKAAHFLAIPPPDAGIYPANRRLIDPFEGCNRYSDQVRRTVHHDRFRRETPPPRRGVDIPHSGHVSFRIGYASYECKADGNVARISDPHSGHVSSRIGYASYECKADGNVARISDPRFRQCVLPFRVKLRIAPQMQESAIYARHCFYPQWGHGQKNAAAGMPATAHLYDLFSNQGLERTR